MLQNELMVRWPSDLEEFVFTSNTALITKETVEEALIEKRLIEIVKKVEQEDDNRVAKLDDVDRTLIRKYELETHNKYTAD